jgi:hypothetical protein
VTLAAITTLGAIAFAATGRPVTFWSGFVLASRPGCVPLRVWIDRERAPRHA